jgi:hypothetical protein
MKLPALNGRQLARQNGVPVGAVSCKRCIIYDAQLVLKFIIELFRNFSFRVN